MDKIEHVVRKSFRAEMAILPRNQTTFDDFLDLEIEILRQNQGDKTVKESNVSNQLDDSTFLYFALKTLSGLEPNHQLFPAINSFTDWDLLLKVFVRESRVAFYPEEEERAKEKQWAKIGKRLAFEKLESTVEEYRQTIKNKSTNVMDPINETLYFRRFRVFLAIKRSLKSVIENPENKSMAKKKTGVGKTFLRIVEDFGDKCEVIRIPYDQQKLNSNNQDLAQRHKSQIDNRNQLRKWLFEFGQLGVSMDTLKSSIRDAKALLRPYLRPTNEIELPEELFIDDEDAFKAISRFAISEEHENWRNAYAHYMQENKGRLIHRKRLNKLFD